MYIGSLSLPDAVEAAVRSGDGKAGERRSSGCLTGVGHADSLGARPAGARAALMAPDEDAEPFYAEALDHLGRSGVPRMSRGSRLVYGEWLRRQRRRRDARVQLRQAHEMLRRWGRGICAQGGGRAGRDGERARARVDETRDQLTPQERQVAQLAAEESPNAEIAAQLFISPHTVAYHLRKVFNKLSVSSRNQLAKALGEPLQPSPQSG